MDGLTMMEWLNGVDDKLKREADIFYRSTPPKRTVVKSVFRWAAAAAVFVVMIGAFVFMALVQQRMETVSNSGGTPAYAGKTITITREEIDRERAFEEALAVETASEEEIVKTLAIPKLLAIQAEKAGLPNRDEDYQAFLEEYERTLRGTPDFMEKWPAYQKAYGMTMEEYFESRKTNPEARRSWYGDTYKKYLKEQFENGEAPLLHNGDLPLTWNEYYKAYLEQLLQEENLKRVGERADIDEETEVLLVFPDHEAALEEKGFSWDYDWKWTMGDLTVEQIRTLFGQEKLSFDGTDLESKYTVEGTLVRDQLGRAQRVEVDLYDESLPKEIDDMRYGYYHRRADLKATFYRKEFNGKEFSDEWTVAGDPEKYCAHSDLWGTDVAVWMGRHEPYLRADQYQAKIFRAKFLSETDPTIGIQVQVYAWEDGLSQDEAKALLTSFVFQCLRPGNTLTMDPDIRTTGSMRASPSS